MPKKESLTEKLLYMFADLADYGARARSWKGALSLPDDPRFSGHKRWLKKMLKNKKQKQKIREAIYNLKRGKFLQEKVLSDNSRGFALTSKGRLKSFRFYSKAKKIKKLPSGQYLMVFFDIPEKKRKTRDALRLSLKEFGFEKIQKSVWVSPYDVRDELKKIIKECGLDDFVKLLLVKELP